MASIHLKKRRKEKKEQSTAPWSGVLLFLSVHGDELRDLGVIRSMVRSMGVIRYLLMRTNNAR